MADKRLFVLDTNVLMHDPTALFRFQEHDIYLPMVVLEELDNNKKGHSEVARNARQASRFMDELMVNISTETIAHGIPLTQGSLSNSSKIPSGNLFFQTETLEASLPSSLPGSKSDNTILGTALALKTQQPERSVTLVSKDTNMRIKAAILGIHSEDYRNDQVLEDVELLYRGMSEISDDFWEQHSKEMHSWQEEGRTFYRLSGPGVDEWYPNQFIQQSDEEAGFQAIVRNVVDGDAIIETTRDFASQNHNVWGITARNREQNFALNLLMDPEIDFVTLVGQAGTGKTLLTLAAGLAQTLDEQRYAEIIMTRVTVSVGEDIGFLPGTEEEKMTPWMGALMDNLEVLTQSEHNSDWERAATNDLLNKRIKIRSLNFMRGRTFLNKFIIIDEAQNLTSKQMKTLITRAGPGTKMICLGNIAQIDTPYLTETNSGLTYVVDRFKEWEHSGHMTLLRGERSRLADFASEML
ncbi:MAG: PhoH family protein [Gammaproteobacteria bacterium]|nr:PhoH family protein [Gammaproteobacteria bacterium]MCW8840199.1 PhoH family protein [Gammaproteobacteria bacterium]MCW8959131.1 PhoH family protein [Gammaproteobacteria bacterium]MCW8973008.1 PhoH family protein [Gammaproteobacteria bacterium]MCW8991792.1 PhoH family protein [Gammaproteobacteria bacterium]